MNIAEIFEKNTKDIYDITSSGGFTMRIGLLIISFLLVKIDQSWVQWYLFFWLVACMLLGQIRETKEGYYITFKNDDILEETYERMN